MFDACSRKLGPPSPKWRRHLKEYDSGGIVVFGLIWLTGNLCILVRVELFWLYSGFIRTFWLQFSVQVHSMIFPGNPIHEESIDEPHDDHRPPRVPTKSVYQWRRPRLQPTMHQPPRCHFGLDHFCCHDHEQTSSIRHHHAVHTFHPITNTPQLLSLADDKRRSTSKKSASKEMSPKWRWSSLLRYP